MSSKPAAKAQGKPRGAPAAPPHATLPGSRFPPGASATAEGVNFCIFSRHATRAELLLYADADALAPFQTIELDPEHNRSFFFWHVFVEGLPAGMHYTWRMDGPCDTAASGRRFYPDRELLDPWARAVSDALWTAGAPAPIRTARRTPCAASSSS